MMVDMDWIVPERSFTALVAGYCVWTRVPAVLLRWRGGECAESAEDIDRAYAEVRRSLCDQLLSLHVDEDLVCRGWVLLVCPSEEVMRRVYRVAVEGDRGAGIHVLTIDDRGRCLEENP